MTARSHARSEKKRRRRRRLAELKKMTPAEREADRLNPARRDDR